MSIAAALGIAIQIAALAREVTALQGEVLDVIGKARSEGREPTDAELAGLRAKAIDARARLETALGAPPAP